jgi:hypothetical protein
MDIRKRMTVIFIAEEKRHLGTVIDIGEKNIIVRYETPGLTNWCLPVKAYNIVRVV